CCPARTEHAWDNADDPEAGAVSAGVGWGGAALGRTAAAATVGPGCAPQHTLGPRVRALRVSLGALAVRVRVVPVGAPLLDVAVHIEEAPGVGSSRTDRVRPVPRIVL